MIRLKERYSEAGRLTVSGLGTIVYVVNAYSVVSSIGSSSFRIIAGSLPER